MTVFMGRRAHQADDDLARAVVDVAKELDARRTAWERLRDAARSARLLLEIIYYTKLRSGRG